ncbi:MAG: UDP-2,4-diacetamido-2,4,6-trideoxy-beta-L-altropyranose hydrolase [Desulfobacteraceae bacterium]|nr:UDP-2,4-diacetamido-2,4,6-trideoxy-beta-L-altropyranose hydrolase [Desulfobacteraceae bacterium]
MKKPLVIRADANEKIGLGHVMRCLGLAQLWREKRGPVTFVSANDGMAARERLTREGMQVLVNHVPAGSREDAAETAAIALREGNAWIVVDGYHFSGLYQKAIKDSGCRLLCLDDYGHAEHYHADIIVNQNLQAEKGLYPRREANTKLLLGPRYILLRDEFRRRSKQEKAFLARARKILVTMGGSDQEGATLRVVRALHFLQGQEGYEVRVVAGPAYPCLPTLRQAVREAGEGFRLCCDVQDMAELMAWADLAITAGGSTCWELACMKVPTIVIVLSRDQEPVAAAMATRAGTVNLGWHHEVSERHLQKAVGEVAFDRTRREQIARAAASFVDGKGAERVIQEMQERS